MRMRKKKNLIPRMERCGDFLVRDPYDRRGSWRELMPQARELRLELESGAAAEAYVCYDGGSTWEKAGGVAGDGRVGGYVMQVRPRRCGHLRMKLTGSGGCRLYSASAVYEKGSDVE